MNSLLKCTHKWEHTLQFLNFAFGPGGARQGPLRRAAQPAWTVRRVPGAARPWRLRGWKALEVTGVLFRPFGKILGLRDWVYPHLTLKGSLSSLDLGSRGALEMKHNSRSWGTGARDAAAAAGAGEREGP